MSLGKELIDGTPHKKKSWPSRTCWCQAETVRKAIKAGRADDWSELVKSDKVNPWMMVKLKESEHEVRQDDDQRKSIVQQIMHKR